ncbi:MAG: flagellar hook-length control protein FliK, partial [bacterium]
VEDKPIDLPATTATISQVIIQQTAPQQVIADKLPVIPAISSPVPQRMFSQPLQDKSDNSLSNKNNVTKFPEQNAGENTIQNIIVNNTAAVSEAPIPDNKMAVVQRLQQMLNNTLAQAVQIIQTIPLKPQVMQQQVILTSDFMNESELFTDNTNNVGMRNTHHATLSLDEPIIDFKPDKDFFSHLSALTDKLVINQSQQETITKSAPVISEIFVADSLNMQKTEIKEQNSEKNMQLSAILSNNTVNNMQRNDDNNSKVINVNVSRIIEQIANNVQVVKKDGKHEIILRLDPPTLGELKVRIISDHNGIVTANIEAVQPSVRDSLAARVPELRQALQDAGISLDKCQVSLSSDRSFNDQFTNQPGNGRWQNDNRQQLNTPESFITLPELSQENPEVIMPETATVNYLV